MNLIMPMAGEGSRVQRPGQPYQFKPFIKHKNKMLVEWSMNSVCDIKFEKLFWIVREDHFKQFPIRSFAQYYDAQLIILNQKTMGPADTARRALEKIKLSGPGIVLDCDLYFEVPGLSKFLNNLASEIDGILCYFQAESPLYSYVCFNANTKRAQATSEKEVISNYALLGCYFISDIAQISSLTSKLLSSTYAHKEICFSHVFNKMIALGQNIKCLPARSHKSLGTLEDI